MEKAAGSVGISPSSGRTTEDQFRQGLAHVVPKAYPGPLSLFIAPAHFHQKQSTALHFPQRYALHFSLIHCSFQMVRRFSQFPFPAALRTHLIFSLSTFQSLSPCYSIRSSALPPDVDIQAQEEKFYSRSPM